MRKKQTNKSDVAVVESSETYITIYLPFPGLYLTYDRDGLLLATQTIAEREKAGGTIVKLGGNVVLSGEMGSDNYGQVTAPTEVYDDDVPF